MDSFVSLLIIGQSERSSWTDCSFRIVKAILRHVAQFIFQWKIIPNWSNDTLLTLLLAFGYLSSIPCRTSYKSILSYLLNTRRIVHNSHFLVSSKSCAMLSMSCKLVIIPHPDPCDVIKRFEQETCIRYHNVKVRITISESTIRLVVVWLSRS